MAKTDTPVKPEPTETEAKVVVKKPRTILTPQQRIEKAEAELAALRSKEADKAKAKVATLDEAIAKAEAKVKEAADKVVVLKQERAALVPTDES